MYTVSVWPDKLREGDPEQLTGAAPTLEAWLLANVDDYAPRTVPLYSIGVNGALVSPLAWSEYPLVEGDHVDVTIEPKGLLEGIFFVLALVSAAYAYQVAKSIPDNYQTTDQRGESIYSANVRGNRARPGGIIPEQSGTLPVYGDLINAPYRQYEDNDEWVYFGLSLGVGEFDVHSINIGETSISEYAGDVIAQLFGPGESLSGNLAHLHVYTAPEVGETSTGSLEIRYDRLGLSDGDWRYTTSGYTITSTLQGASASFPFSVGERFVLGNGDGYIYEVDALDGGVNQVATVSRGKYPTVGFSGSFRGVNPARFAGREWFVYDDAWLGFDLATDIELDLESDSRGGGSWIGSFYAAPEKEVTNKFSICLRFNGLGEYDEQNNLGTRRVGIQVRYREVGAEEWTVWTKYYEDATRDYLGFTEDFIIEGTAIRPEVQLRRITEDSDNALIIDRVYWVRLKCELDSPTRYDDITTLMCAIRGTNAIAANAENRIWTSQTRRLHSVRDLQNAALGLPLPDRQATSAPGAFLAYVTEDAGYVDALDLEAFDEFDALLAARGDELNAQFAERGTMRDAHVRILSVGYGEPLIDFGALSVVRRVERSDLGQLYTPFNTTSDIERSGGLYDPDEPDGVRVNFYNPVLRAMDYVDCRLDVAGDPPSAEAKKRHVMQAFGVTDRDRAWRLGMRVRRRFFYKPTIYTFDTENDGLNSFYYDTVHIADDLTGGMQGYVTAYDAATQVLTTDQPLTFENDTMLISVADQAGQIIDFFYGTPVADQQAVQLAAPLGRSLVFNRTMELPRFAFGTLDECAERAVVNDIQISGTENCTLTCEEFVPEINADDDNFPPEE